MHISLYLITRLLLAAVLLITGVRDMSDAHVNLTRLKATNALASIKFQLNVQQIKQNLDRFIYFSPLALIFAAILCLLPISGRHLFAFLGVATKCLFITNPLVFGPEVASVCFFDLSLLGAVWLS